MDLDIINTAASALYSQRLKMDTVAANIANSHTTKDAQGESNPYRRKIVNFQTVLDGQNQVRGIEALVEEDQSSFNKVFDPSHPDANAEGYVLYPNISREQEMVDLMSAKSAYEANIKTIQVVKQMYNASLEI